MNHTFVGSTIYHIYLSLLYLIRESNYRTAELGENILILVESTPMIELLIPRLKKKYFREVYIISERKEHLREIGKFNYTFRRKAKLLPFLEEKFPFLRIEEEFIENSNLLLCDTDSSKSYFLYKYAPKQLSMIEDGARTYSRRHTYIEQFLKTYLTKTPVGGGFEKEIKTIYAQFPERLPKGIREKARELNIKKEVSKLDRQTKKEIFEIFIPENNLKVEGVNKALVLTQPISEDRVVKDEETKIGIYKDVIKAIPPGMKVYLKTHPRELTKYELHFPDIVILPGLFPIEVLGLNEGFVFERGYTLFSTALSNLEIVKERYFLGKNYLNKFTAKATRALIRNMVG